MSIVDSVLNVINYQVPINVAPLYSKTYAGSNTVPFWLLVAAFAILFSIVWLASSYINLFKEEKNKGPRSIFAIAVSFIALFGTPLAIWLMKVIYTFTTLSIIALLILGVYIIWTLTKSGWAESAKTNADSSKIIADASSKNALTKKQNYDTKAYKEKTMKASSEGVHYQIREIKKTKTNMQRILRSLQDVKRKNTYPVGKNTISRLTGDMSKVRTDLGKIIPFISENDRLLSTMSSSDYEVTAPSNLTGLTVGGKSIIDNLKKETGDLGSTISSMAESLQKNGIPDAEANNRLISWAEVAINIANRMERDIVLEKQMIERM